NGTLIVSAGRFACVGKCTTGNSAHVVDLKGATVIPGLIDVHEHITNLSSGVATLRRPTSLLALAYGLTTIVDPSSSSATLVPLGDMIECGRGLGLRMVGSAEPVFAAGPWTDMGVRLDVATPEDAEYEISRRASWGTVITKNYLLARREQ